MGNDQSISKSYGVSVVCPDPLKNLSPEQPLRWEQGTWASPFSWPGGNMIVHVYGDTIVPATLLNNCLSSTCRSPHCWLNVFHRLTSWNTTFLKGGTKKSTKSVCFNDWGNQIYGFPHTYRHPSVHRHAQGADSKPWERKRSRMPSAASSLSDAPARERIQNIAQIPDLIDSNSWNDLINLWGFGGMILVVAETVRNSPPVWSTFLPLFHPRNAETARPMRMTRTTRSLCLCTRFNTREQMKTSQRTKEGKEKNT